MKKAIQDYIPLVIEIQKAKNPDYCPEKDSGLIGDAFELAVKDYFHKPLKLSPAGRIDIRIGTRNVEIKQGAGEIGHGTDKLMRGAGVMLFVPVVLEAYPLTMQDGYVMNRQDFLDAMQEAGALRTKPATRGGINVTLQTFWNRKQNKPHGRLLAKMQDAMEAREYTELCEFLAQFDQGED